MKVSHPHFAGPTGKPTPKTQTERTNSPSLTKPKDSSPDHFERSQTASLPTPPNQQEITDSNRQQPFQKIMRPSRHEQHKGTLTSEETDDECDSPNNKIRRNATNRIAIRKFTQSFESIPTEPREQQIVRFNIPTEQERQYKAAILDHIPPELGRQYKQAKAAMRDFKRQQGLGQTVGFSIPPDLIRQYKQAKAAIQDFIPRDLLRQYIQAEADRLNIPIVDLIKQHRQARAEKWPGIH
jgi:hypothetical protein